MARHFPERTLFLCWPPYRGAMASKSLEFYAGKTVIYVGEGHGGCTGDDKFHRMLECGWEEVEEVEIPQWDGIHDRMWVYRRRSAT